MNNNSIAQSYLNQHRIIPLFQELTALLVYTQPTEPRSFLVDTLLKIKERKAFPYRPQDLDFLFPSTSTEEESSITKTEKKENEPKTNEVPEAKNPEEPKKEEVPFVPDFMQTPEEVEQVEQVASKMQAVFRGKRGAKSAAKAKESPKVDVPKEEEKETQPVSVEVKSNKEDTTERKNQDLEEKAMEKLEENSKDNEDPATRIIKEVTDELNTDSKPNEGNQDSTTESGNQNESGADHHEDTIQENKEQAVEKAGIQFVEIVEEKSEEHGIEIQTVPMIDAASLATEEHDVATAQKPASPQQPKKSPFLQVDENMAAVKIQSVYRGHSVRKTIPQASFKAGVLMMDQNPQDAITEHIRTTEAIPEEKEADQDDGVVVETKIEDEKAMNDAAIRIQAVYRGHNARKSIAGEMKLGTSEAQPEPDAEGNLVTQTDAAPGIAVDDVDDPAEAERAATRIQASFRGYRTRKEIHGTKESPSETSD